MNEGMNTEEEKRKNMGTHADKMGTSQSMDDRDPDKGRMDSGEESDDSVNGENDDQHSDDETSEIDKE